MKKINPIDESNMLRGAFENTENGPQDQWSPLLSRIRDRIGEERLSDAARILEEAETYLIDGDEIEQGLLYHLKCVISHKQGAYQRSIDEGEEACRLLERTDRDSVVGETRRTIAKSKVLLGLIDQAVLDYEEALLLLRKAGEVSLCLATINNLAQVYFIQGKWQLTRELLERGLRDASCHGAGSLLYSFTMNLGTLSFARGKVKEAKDYFERCGTMLQEKESAKVCRLNIMKGNLALLTGDLETAKDHFDSALAIARELELSRELALALEGTADVAMESGDLTRSRSDLDAALEIAGNIAPRGDLMSELLRRKGDVALRQGRIREAKEDLERSIAVSRHLGDRLEEGAATGLLGEVYCKMGKAEAAGEHFTRAIDMLTDLNENWERARILLKAASSLRELHGTDRVGHECLAYLEKAAELFGDLGLTGSKALVDLETAAILFELEEYDRAGAIAVAARGALRSGGPDNANARVDRLISEIEQILARRSIQRCNELTRSELAFTVTSDREEAGRRGTGHLDVLLERCSFDAAFLVDLEKNERPSLATFSNMEEHEANELLHELLGIVSRNGCPLLIAMDALVDERYLSLETVARRGVRSFLFWSTKRPGGRTRHLYLERTDSRRDTLLERDLFLIEALSKEFMLDGSMNERNPSSAGHGSRICVSSSPDYRGIITRSYQLLNVLGTVEKVKDSTLPVLLEGETGTGKELIARAVHERGRRRIRKFCAVNCAAIPEHLLESELFGHRRGAFTGAVRDKVGLFEVADGGTFFLDEIADMGIGLQVKLLRFLEQGEFKRLGDIDVRHVDVRVVSATNKTLTEEVERGNFRKDLFYRLNGIRIKIPPLRERREDIPPLVEWYLKKIAEEDGKKIRGIRRDALELLLCFDWPGNVRELINELRRASTLSEEGGWIVPACLSERVRESLRRKACGDREKEMFSGQGSPGDLPNVLANFERGRILDAMKATGGVKLRAARNLGLHEATLRGKLKKYRIVPSEWEV